MKFLSSIFSFETLRAVDLPSHWKASVVLMAALLVTAELGARFLLAPVGDHLWAYSPGTSPTAFEWYRALATEDETPGIVAIGDSTGARNFDPKAFSAASSFGDAYTLARPGNFPLAMRGNTLPLLQLGQPPEIVLLFQWAGSFRDDPRVERIERGSISPVLEARREGRVLVTDYLYLSRLYPARQYLSRYWIAGEPLLQPAGFGSFAPLVKSGDEAGGREVVATTRDADIVFSEVRREVLKELSQIAREQGFQVVAVIGPQREPERDKVTREHIEWLKALASEACRELVLLDMRTAPYIELSSFKDENHLFADAAASFSREVARRMSDLSLADPGSRCSPGE